jgi:hypothetical protein
MVFPSTHVLFYFCSYSELAVPVPNLLAMCELAIFYTLYTSEV